MRKVLGFRVQGSGFRAMRKMLGEFLSRTLTWVSNMYSFHRSHHPRVEESPSLLNMEITEGRISTTPSLGTEETQYEQTHSKVSKETW